LILYEHPSSGNCLKARVMLDQVGASYERVELDLFAGETRTPEHFARNPDGRIPVLELDDGTFLAESGAILLYLAEGTRYLPEDPVERARVHAWMFFEQNQVEANIGVARFLALSGRAQGVPEVFADRQRRGREALATLDRGLAGREWLVGDAYSVADLALYGYVHVADDAGVPLAEHSAVAAWVRRVKALPGFEEGLTPMPAHASRRTL
jgi:glutathione S-transferase